MLVREYIDEDFERVVFILKHSFLEISEKISKSLKLSSDLSLDKNKYTQLVAVIDDKVVGYLIASRNMDFILKRVNFWIDYVCVDEEYRGRGIAKMLLTTIEKMAKNEDALYLQLTSSRFRTVARKMYYNLGFEVRESDIFRKVL